MSKSIFHYTNTFGQICHILDKGFIPSFCKESLFSSSKSVNFAVPMVSFCDISITKADIHKDKYGQFAIGMSKKWALASQLNPIYYIDPQNTLSDSILKSLLFQLKWLRSPLLDIEEKAVLRYNLVRCISFYKNYEGQIKSGKNVCFYEEKEWRYVPTFKKNNKIETLFYNSNNFNQMKLKYPRKPHFPNHPLPFKLKDVTHIVCPNITQKRRLISCLSESIVKESDFYELLTKILTYREIANDL